MPLHICPDSENAHHHACAHLQAVHRRGKLVSVQVRPLDPCTTLVADADSGGPACVGAGGHGKSLHLPLSFAMNIKLP